MTTTSFKCLNCGAGIHFNPDYGKFKCEYCLSEFTEEQLNKGTKIFFWISAAISILALYYPTILSLISAS